MHVGCDSYTTCFYLFKVMFICFYTNMLFIVFAFFFFCANKVELTKADLQGREGCGYSSPLLVSMKDAFM